MKGMRLAESKPLLGTIQGPCINVAIAYCSRQKKPGLWKTKSALVDVYRACPGCRVLTDLSVSDMTGML